ncbi:ATP-binding protein [Bifidobacterium sp. ESL0728]|uniref:ATP-binding protein n=1 Tax=Bifidobacterium sp. ESL0728 TaxID=2983220 RepID=UPI0023F64E1E|nr:ATP-binding protein [Bifidobacterium sp. ESL0728]WEV59695.1 ATP-binding protein [Bifidobacterium sp. ESL0728]
MSGIEVGMNEMEERNVFNTLTDAGAGVDEGHEPVWGVEAKRMFDTIVAERKARRRLEEHHLRPVSRVLLTGVPGTGKTTMAMSLADKLDMRLARVRADRLITSDLGGTLRNIGVVFDVLGRETSYPTLLFLDEADALLTSRKNSSEDVAEMRRAANVFLQAMDGWKSVHLLVAATNLADLIDPAALRRFDMVTEMPMTDKKTAERIIKARFKEIMLEVGSADTAMLAGHAEGLAPALILNAIDRQARTDIVAGKPVDLQAIADDLDRLRDKQAKKHSDKQEEAK